jgi:heme/copper-type cytochrome/quinol oxidase subunit 2
MGAVFALFAGFYYWIEKMSGCFFSEALGKIHFWLFFFGVNITFMPMHLLGLAGMPRRISDYPDAFSEWNKIASIGSSVSVISTFLFIYIVYDCLIYGKRQCNNPWKIEKNDAPEHYQISFQDPATPMMSGIIDLHHDIMFYLIIVVIFVLWMLLRIVFFFKYSINKNIQNFKHHTALEIIWTLIPSLILFTITIPSFSLLYAMDEMLAPQATLKAIGHQWYWSYECGDKCNYLNEIHNFDSYMKNVPAEKFLRLLEVDNNVVLPIKTSIRILITSSDVLHSWAIPSLGLKLDACPGRLNQVHAYILRQGMFYGQCSEICGTNHGFMPIVIEAKNFNF